MIMTQVIAAGWQADTATAQAVFSIDAVAEPQALLRILDIFARRDLLPSQVDTRVTPAGLLVNIRLACDDRVAELLSACLNAQACVKRAEVISD